MGNKLYVGNLDFQTTAEDLVALFAGAGPVVHAQVITDRGTGQSKGFAFVEMSDEATALKAIGLYNGQLLNERTMVVNESRSREERASGGNFGRGDTALMRPKFREIKHKSRGGANRRRF